MSEYIISVDDEGAAARIIELFGADKTKVYGYALTGEEIVRCRDCKHYEPLEGERGDWCQYWTYKVYGDGDGFCAWAVRRES